ncbi:carbohydrate kinase [Microbacterium pseudoresistens]|uniref:Fructokinase n=1 Tax=Microbacterium pseudoresistens TaxID=640634 RepID=A0A7Y9EXE6_9MICO|nr:PfkB family carbohydrate kinase [Microbacterium pseudoresistens]NYD55737.1 fructokinase [Microbacterium pseudoresistens]
MSSSAPRTVAVIGEALVDIVDGMAHPGGSPMNVAVGLARLGEPVTLHTLLGADAHGDLIRAHLDESAVTVGNLSDGDGATWAATAELAGDGSATYRFRMDGTIPVPALAGLRAVHTGSIGALRAAEAGSVLAAFSAADASTLRSLDPNIRADVMGEGARERAEQLAAQCHVVKLSDEDAAWLYPGESLEDVLARIAALGPRFVVATRGGEGCLALVDGVLSERPATPVVVADTIGAGDAFMSGLLFGLLRDDADRAIVEGAALSAERIARALATASASASVAVSRTGANPPRPAELADALARMDSGSDDAGLRRAAASPVRD